jgi:hypothetical protein
LKVLVIVLDVSVQTPKLPTPMFDIQGPKPSHAHGFQVAVDVSGVQIGVLIVPDVFISSGSGFRYKVPVKNKTSDGSYNY